MKQWAWALAQGASHFTYYEIRPIPVHSAKDGSEVLVTDCSGLTTILCYWAGMPDPNGLGYNGEGNSDTMYDYLPHIALADAFPGDLVIYGPSWATLHVATIGPSPAGVATQDVPYVYSFGSSQGPLYMPLKDLNDAFPGQPVTYCQIVSPSSVKQ
jgi:hypothetical protein